MDKRIHYFAAALLLLGCSESVEDLSSSQANVGYGRVYLSSTITNEVELSSTRSEEVSKYYIDDSLLPSSTDLSLIIDGDYIDAETGETMELFYYYESLDAYNTAEDVGELIPPYLPAGTYTFTLSDNKKTSVEGETNACFSGSKQITVVARDSDGQETISVTLQNSIITLSTTEEFDNYFEGGAKLTLSTEGGAEINYDSSLDLGEQYLFVAPDTKLYLEGEATKQDPDGSGSTSASTVTFTRIEIGTTTKGALSRVSVDAEETGGSMITIILDDTVESVGSDEIELNK